MRAEMLDEKSVFATRTPIRATCDLRGGIAFLSHRPIARAAYDRVGRSLNFGWSTNDLGLASFSSRPTVPLEIYKTFPGEALIHPTQLALPGHHKRRRVISTFSFGNLELLFLPPYKSERKTQLSACRP
jgi:hypothetical protein